MKNDARRGRDINTSFKKERARKEKRIKRVHKKGRRKRENRKKQLRLLTGVKESLDEDRTFANIDEESVRSPTPNELDERGRNAVFCQGSRPTSTHGLTCNIMIEEPAEAGVMY